MGFAAKPLKWPVLSNLVVTPADLRSCASGPGYFFRRYRSCFSHIQQAEAARIYLEGQDQRPPPQDRRAHCDRP